MPYYSELGLSTPTSSAYSSLHLSGPYSNHSSIIASNYSPLYSKPVGRTFRGGFKPHLTTISELNSSLRGSPNLYYKSSPKISYRPIKTINTADIDVSKNRLRKFEKYERPKTENVENSPVDKTSAKPTESPTNSLREQEAKPNSKIRRDRPTIRLQTVHTDALEKQIKSWRDNFEPNELAVESRRKKKTPGEVLKEKFLIRSRSKENILNCDSQSKNRTSVEKSPSFHDICQAITSEDVEDELNPGQPVEIRRKQSRQLSENIIREIRRNSTDLSEEELQLLDVILAQEHEMNDHIIPKEEDFSSRESVRKKHISGDSETVPKFENKISTIDNNKQNKTISRTPQRKKIRTHANIKPSKEVEELTKDIFENTIRDISQVDIEQTTFKPKPIIRASVGHIEQTKPTLKAVINDVEVQEISNKPEKKFRLNVIVEVQDGNSRKPLKRPSKKYGEKIKLSEDQFCEVRVPKTIEPVISNLPIQKSVIFAGQVDERNKDIRVKMKLQNMRTQLPKAANPIVSNIMIEKEVIQSGEILDEKEIPQKLKSDTQSEIANNECPHQQMLEISSSNENSTDSCEVEMNQGNEAESNMTAEQKKKLISKRSLVQKAGKEDPDLEVFSVPEMEVQKPEPEPENESNTFVPLQSNRLTQFMNQWKKPEQYDVCPVEIYARPKLIRGRHYPRPRGHPAQPSPDEESTSDDDDDDDEQESQDSSSDETASEEEGTVSSKIGTSISSNDSGFESGALCKNKECGVNIHKKCEKLSANLCGVNQKLVVEAIENVRKDSVESRDSPTLNHANNPAFAPDSDDIPEEYSQSSTFRNFQSSGRITPPATTIPRFRKYCLDDFNFLKVLGKGSFGKVLLAELRGTEYYYAVKCLKKDVVLEDDDVECTLIERKVLALGTKHPFLCHLLCTFQTDSHLFFVMEYLNGGDLMFHIQASGGFPEHQARFYGAEIVSGLKFLHNKGIIYRDLKLDNVLLDFDGHVRIADFGMCKLQVFLDRMAETFCGTPDYMAPEIIKGQHYNQNVDWWSFGVLLYEMLLGQSPFSGCDEDELFWSICNEKPVLPKYLSPETVNVLTLLLEKDSTKRLGNRFCPHGDIQDHAFFKPIDWQALEARALEPPFKPNLKHPLDTQYFDKNFTAEKPKLTVVDPTILRSMDQTQFQGFSYTNPNATDK